MTGPATREQLEELWHLLLQELRSKLSGLRVSAEMLAIARLFLANSGFVSSRVNSPATQRMLERIDKLYQAKLIEGLSTGAPSAGMLAEARHYSDRIKAQQAQQQAEQGPAPLAIDMPFKVK